MKPVKAWAVLHDIHSAHWKRGVKVGDLAAVHMTLTPDIRKAFRKQGNRVLRVVITEARKGVARDNG